MIRIPFIFSIFQISFKCTLNIPGDANQMNCELHVQKANIAYEQTPKSWTLLDQGLWSGSLHGTSYGI